MIIYDRKNSSKHTAAIVERCKRDSIAIEYSTPHTMNILLKKAGDDGDGHQNVILKVKEMGEAKEIGNEEFDVYDNFLVLYNLTDPQNLGAIIRSAQFIMGKSMIIILVGKNSLMKGKPSVLRASAGAMEEYWGRGVRRFDRALQTLISLAQDKNINVIGTEAGSLIKENGNNSIFSIKRIKIVNDGIDGCLKDKASKTKRMVIMGSEGLGIGKDNLNLCTYSVSINGFNIEKEVDPFFHLDSLNVSVSTGIILANWSSLPSL